MAHCKLLQVVWFYVLFTSVFYNFLLQTRLCKCIHWLHIQLICGSPFQCLLCWIPQSMWREGSGAFSAKWTTGHGYREHQLWLEWTREGMKSDIYEYFLQVIMKSAERFVQSHLKVIGTAIPVVFFPIYLRFFSLRPKDEHKTVDKNFRFYFLIFTARSVELRTWHLLFKHTHFSSDQKYWKNLTDRCFLMLGLPL